MKKLLFTAAMVTAFMACQKVEQLAPVNTGKPSKPVVAPKYDTIADNTSFHLQFVKDAVYSDESVIVFNHTNSTASGDASDAPDFGGINPPVSLSVLSSDGRDMAIDAVPYTRGMSIGVDLSAAASGPYSLGINNVGPVPQSIHIWLKDALQKDSLDLRTGNYSFNIDNSNADTYGNKRFTLVLR